MQLADISSSSPWSFAAGTEEGGGEYKVALTISSRLLQPEEETANAHDSNSSISLSFVVLASVNPDSERENKTAPGVLPMLSSDHEIDEVSTRELMPSQIEVSDDAKSRLLDCSSLNPQTLSEP